MYKYMYIYIYIHTHIHIYIYVTRAAGAAGSAPRFRAQPPVSDRETFHTIDIISNVIITTIVIISSCNNIGMIMIIITTMTITITMFVTTISSIVSSCIINSMDLLLSVPVAYSPGDPRQMLKNCTPRALKR